MGEDDLHVGEINRDVVDQHWLAVFEPDPAAAAHSGAHAGVPGVEDRGQPVLGDHLVDRLGHPVGGVCVLHDPVELETFDPEILDQVARLSRA